MVYSYKHDQIAVQSMRIRVSVNRLIDVVLLSASMCSCSLLVSISLRNWSVSAAHDPDHGDINLISKACADLQLTQNKGSILANILHLVL